MRPGSVISFALTSTMREASVTDSEPELRHMNFSYGQPPRVWPISALSALPNFSCDRFGVITFAITCGRPSTPRIAFGAWPEPSMP